MGLSAAIAGQKGGSGKTTTATGWAVYAAKEGLRVAVGDMDVGQASAIEWAEKRKAMKQEPEIRVTEMSPKAIAKAKELVDLLVLDLPGRADDLTVEVAEQVDLMVIVADTNRLELNPTIHLLRALQDKGLAAPKVVVALTKVRDEDREKAARAYLTTAGFPPLPDVMWDFDSVHDVGNEGKGASEIPYPAVLFPARRFFKGLFKALEGATRPKDKIKDKEHVPSRKREAQRDGRGG